MDLSVKLSDKIDKQQGIIDQATKTTKGVEDALFWWKTGTFIGIVTTIAALLYAVFK